MFEKESYKRIIKIAFSCMIILAELLIYYYIWVDYCNNLLREPFFRKGNWLIGLIYLCFLMFLHNIYGGLKVNKYKKTHLIYSHIFTLFICNLIAYAQMVLIDKKFHSPLLYICITVFQILVMLIWLYIYYYFYKHVFPPRRLVAIVGERPVFSMIEKLKLRNDKYIVEEVINAYEDIDKMMQKITKYDGVIIGDIESHERNVILKQCYSKNIRVYTVPKISDILIRSSYELNLFDTPFLVSIENGLMIEQECVKRTIDIVLSFILLIITMPIMLVACILIKVSDGGPIFYTQDRLTKDGKVFKIIKLRTMKVDAESDGVARLATKKDNRVSKLGNILRSTRIDELPQFINILKGDMSIVGPRPERPEIASQYEKIIPEFRYRLKMKAGLTGYAQIYGKYNTTPFDKLRFDLIYIRNYSLWLDIKLILMTPKIVFMKDSTEGISNGDVLAVDLEHIFK